MKLFCFVLISLFSLTINAQKIDVKCDSFQFVYNAQQAIIYKKNKVGLYDVANQNYLIKPTKTPLIHLDDYNFTLLFDKNELQMLSFDKTGKKYLSTNVNYEQHYNYQCLFPESSIDSLKNYHLWNSILLLPYQSGEPYEELSKEEIDNINFDTYLSIESISSNEIIFNYCRYLYDLIDYTGILGTEFSKSGVYNFIDKKWMIPPKYANCTQVDSFIFCQTNTENIIIETDEEYTYEYHEKVLEYDVYLKKGNEYQLEIKGLKKMDSPTLAQLYDLDSAEIQADEDYFLAYNNNKVGLLYFDLEKWSDELISLELPLAGTILPIEYDFLIFHEEMSNCIGVKDSEITFWSANDNAMAVVEMAKLLAKGHSSIFWGLNFNHKSLCLVDNEMLKFEHSEYPSIDNFRSNGISDRASTLMNNFGFGLELLDDGKLIVTKYKSDEIDPFAAPLLSWDYPDEDSVIVDADGNIFTVYPPAIIGYDRSGVYDLKQKEWFIEPQHRTVTRYGDNYIIESLERNELGEAIGPLYSIIEPNGNSVISRITDEQIAANPEKQLNLFLGETHVPFPERSIYRQEVSIAPNANNISVNQFDGEYYYVQNEDEKWSVIKPFNMQGAVDLEPKIKWKDFVHYNPSMDYAFWIENGKCYIEIQDSIISFKQSPGELIIKYQIHEYGGMGIQYEFKYKSGTDSIYHISEAFDDELYFEIMMITINDNLLVINEPQKFHNFSNADGSIYEYEYVYGGDFDYSQLKMFDAQTSSIWKKVDGAWTKATPFYASIDVLPFGYLAKTGDYGELIDLFDNTFKREYGSVVLLDSNCKAISFFDYFDFSNGSIQDFGIALCINSGCFLVNNRGEAITAAEWDRFEWEDGKVKAMKFSEKYLKIVNEYSDDPFFWEDITEEEIYEKVAYFELN